MPPCDLVHDQCASFEAVYQHVFDLYQNAEPAEIVMTEAERTCMVLDD